MLDEECRCLTGTGFSKSELNRLSSAQILEELVGQRDALFARHELSDSGLKGCAEVHPESTTEYEQENAD